MALIARIGDNASGTCNPGLPCCPHGWTGPIVSGSPTITVELSPAARVGDTGSCNCPHGGTYVIVSGSDTILADGKPLARIGDSVVCQSCGCSGTIVGSAANTSAG